MWSWNQNKANRLEEEKCTSQRRESVPGSKRGPWVDFRSWSWRRNTLCIFWRKSHLLYPHTFGSHFTQKFYKVPKKSRVKIEIFWSYWHRAKAKLFCSALKVHKIIPRRWLLGSIWTPQIGEISLAFFEQTNLRLEGIPSPQLSFFSDFKMYNF